MSENELDREERLVLLTAATAAPSLYNSQPWRFVVTGLQIDLYADPRRQLREADPHGRELLISCGAALFNLRLAAQHLGREPKVRLLPRRDDPRLVAQVTLASRRGISRMGEMLYDAIPLRHTNRFPFEDDDTIPAEAGDAMASAARLEGAELIALREGTELGRMAEIVHLADIDLDHRPGLAVEAAAWTAVEADRSDGVPGYALGPLADSSETPVRDLRRGAPMPDRPHTAFERSPHLLVLATRDDDHASWVRAGQALQRVLLTATLHGLSASFVNQPLESPDLRDSVLAAGSQHGHPQMVMRIGHGSPVPPTPRRPLDDVTGRDR